MTTVTSDLNIENTLTITATSYMGFAGDVTLSVAAADSASAPITDWTAALTQTTLTLAAAGTASTTLKLSALGDTSALEGTLKVTATTSAGVTDASANVAFNPVLVVAFNDDGTGKCVYPVNHAVNNPWKIKAGRKIRVLNNSATLGLQVHTDNAAAGFPHDNTVHAPGTGYERTVTSAGDQSEFYCHNPGDGTAMVEGGANSGARNYLRVVQ